MGVFGIFYLGFSLFILGIAVYLMILLIKLARRGIIAVDLYIDEKNSTLK